MAMRTVIIIMVLCCLLPSPSQGGQNDSVPEDGEQGTRGATIFQASLMGGGLALIASAMIFDGHEQSVETYWVEDGTGGSIDVPTHSGADTSAMFWTGAAFIALAALLELFPHESDAAQDNLVRNPTGNGGPIHFESLVLKGGATGVCVVSKF